MNDLELRFLHALAHDVTDSWMNGGGIRNRCIEAARTVVEHLPTPPPEPTERGRLSNRTRIAAAWRWLKLAEQCKERLGMLRYVQKALCELEGRDHETDEAPRPGEVRGPALYPEPVCGVCGHDHTGPCGQYHKPIVISADEYDVSSVEGKLAHAMGLAAWLHKYNYETPRYANQLRQALDEALRLYRDEHAAWHSERVERVRDQSSKAVELRGLRLRIEKACEWARGFTRTHTDLLAILRGTDTTRETKK